MKITAIKQQVKRQDRLSLYIDGKYCFSLSQPELAKLGIRENQVISHKELADLRSEAIMDKAYDRSINYISIRPRSYYEIETYLQRKKYERNVIAKTLQRLLKLDLINDKNFAQQWLQWRIGSGKSKRRIYSELLQKRIDKEIISEVLSEISPEAELEQVRSLVERKSRMSQYKDKQKLMSYLARQGYGYDLIKKALEN